MELTPIKIPGKNKRTNTKTAIESRKALHRKPGRPRKLLQDASSNSAVEAITLPVKEAKKRTLKTLKSRRKMSLLEKLPMELLELVFQFCLNLDLPKASPVLSGKLASTTIYNWTIMRVFGPSWERGYAGTTLSRGDKEDERGGAKEEVEEENGELQSQVLRCRWASLEVLLRAKEIWVHKYAEDRLFNPLYFLKEKNVIASAPLLDSDPVRNSASQDADDTSPKDTEAPVPSLPLLPRLPASEYLMTDYTDFLTFTSSPDGSWPWHTITWSTYSDLSPTLEIPHSLLAPPFTPPSLKYLFHLLKHGARISWLSSTTGEVALAGLQAAVRQGNAQAIHLLIWSGLLERLDGQMAIWVLRNAGLDEKGEAKLGVDERVKTANHVLRLGYTVLKGRERGMIESELLELRDEALMAGDGEDLEFVRRIVDSETLRGKIDIRV